MAYSRFSTWGEPSNDYEQRLVNLRRATLARVLAGQPAHATFIELEAALVALPTKRLIRGTLLDGADCCLVGALVQKRLGEASADDAARLAARLDLYRLADGDLDCDANDTADIGVEMGLPRTLATHLAYVNDEWWDTATPEERYTQVLAYVRREIDKQTPATP